jgi:hypothetical protein
MRALKLARTTAFRIPRWPAIALAIGSTGVSAQTVDTAALYARLEPSVWVVRTFDKDDLPLSQGSAVVIGAHSLITNCHVLRKAKRVEVTHAKSVSPATLELWDTARDLCQLKATGVQAAAVPLADDAAVVVGQPVVALGTPAGMELTLSAGIVSALRHGDGGRLTAIQTSAAISRGSSGGGLFDAQGRLLGITTAFIGGNAQNLNLALPVSMVRDLPERHAAAQAAKLAPANVAAASTAPPVATAQKESTPPATTAPGAATTLTAGALTGQWSGEFRCGAFLGTAKVPNPNGWNVTAMMTVGSDGSVAIMRGDTGYSETVTGDIQADLSTTLKGRGAMKGKPGSWNTEVTGRFVATGSDYRFDGHGQIGSASGEVSRQCIVTLTKNARI